MAITIPTITALPTPPQKSDPNNFPARADVFVTAQDTMADELNAAIVEMNKLVGGLDQSSPIAAYAAGTTYNFPDVVAYTDGYTYRCIDTSVTGVTPGTDDTKWVNISRNHLPVPTGGILTGNIIGGGYAKTGANEITVDVLSCWDETNSVVISCNSQAVTIGTTANEIYSLFACSDGTIRTDTDATGATTLPAYIKRWIGFVGNTSSGIVKDCYLSGDDLVFTKASEAALFSLTTVPAGCSTAVDISSFIPTATRISHAFLGGRGSNSTSSTTMLVGFDGTNAFHQISARNIYDGDAETEAWGVSANPWMPLMSNNIYWGDGTVSQTLTGQLLLHGVRLMR